MMKKVIDNSKKFWCDITESYLENEDLDFHYYLIFDETGDIITFKSYTDALQYQLGMGIRAYTTIINIFDNVENYE